MSAFFSRSKVSMVTILAVSVATGTTDGQTVEDYLVPSGATFANDVQGTTPVDESTLKAEVRKPLAERHPAKKHAAAK